MQVLDPGVGTDLVSTTLARSAASTARHPHEGSGESVHTDPVLIITLPGLDPLRIRTTPMNGSPHGDGEYRYTWTEARHDARQPQYVVTEAEWLALIEKFGLSSRLVDGVASGLLARRGRRRAVEVVVTSVLLVVVIAISVYLHFMR